MIRIFFRHLREALRSLGRNFLRSLVSIFTVGLTLLLVGGFSAVLFNVNDLAQDIANDVHVQVFVDLAATDSDKETLHKELKNLADVTDVAFSGKNEQLDKIVQKMPSFNIFEGDSNPLYDVYILAVSKPENTKKVADTAAKLKYVHKTNYGGIQSEKMIAITKAIQFWGSILIAVLVVIAILLISNTIRATILARQTEIEIMRLVGATKWFIRWPFLMEGAIIGLLGSIGPVALIYVGYLGVYHLFSVETAGTIYSLLPPDPFLIYVCVSLAALGTVIGAFGSVVSIGRFLRK